MITLLKRNIKDPNILLSTTLFDLYEYAHSNNLDILKKTVESELNGYTKENPPPEYRKAYGRVFANHHQSRVPVPVDFEDPTVENAARTATLYDSLKTLEAVPESGVIQLRIHGLTGTQGAIVEVQGHAIKAILSKIRFHFLNILMEEETKNFSTKVFEVVHEAPIVNCFEVAKSLCEGFKYSVEKRDLWKNLHADTEYGLPKQETKIQPIIRLLSEQYKEFYNVDITAEADCGSGKIDFKISNGNSDKTFVEIKMSSYQKLSHTITTQIPIYLESEKVESCILLVVKACSLVDSDMHEEKISKLKLELENSKFKDKIFLIVADATPKESASVRKE